MSRAQELVDAHFDHYVGPLLTAAGVDEKVVALCAFMYKSSGIHFYKHAQEDAVEAARGAFANDAAHKAPSLCDSGVKREPFTFPAALKFVGALSTDYIAKIREEVDEVATASNPQDVIVELFDVIHAAETAVRSLSKDWNVDADDMRDHCYAKNHARGYYVR